MDIGKGRVLPLSRLRGTVRPLVVAGSKGYVNKVLRDAKRFKADLRERGVSRACPSPRAVLPVHLCPHVQASLRVPPTNAPPPRSMLGCSNLEIRLEAMPAANAWGIQQQAVLFKATPCCVKAITHGAAWARGTSVRISLQDVCSGLARTGHVSYSAWVRQCCQGRCFRVDVWG